MHLYAFDMLGNEDDGLVAALSALRKSQGWSQEEVGQAIGVSQGHTSKVLRKIVPLSNRLKLRVAALLAPPALEALEVSGLEEEVVAALRKSGPFRALVAAALAMHRNK